MTAASTGGVLLERESELAVLGGALEDALSGIGRAVLVEGSAGLGKTRLLDEVCRMADGRARVLRARGGEQERGIPGLVTRELFTPYVVAATEEELGRVLAGAAGLAGPLLGRGAADAGTADAAFALTHGLYWLVANLADELPLVLALDDVHWADEATQRWLAYLLPRIEEIPALMVMAARPRELAPDGPLALGLVGARDLRTVRPADLSPEAAADVVQTLLPTATSGFCLAAHRSTGGNPLLLRSLAREVTHRGIEPSDESARTLERLGAVGIARIVLPRLHALGPDAVELARSVSVLGDGCGFADAAELAAVDRERAATAYDRLVAADVLRADDLAFTHPLVRAAVGEELPPGRRSALHLRAAEVLNVHGADPEDVARHVAATEPVREEWVVPVLRDAAGLATRRGAPEAAVRHLVALLREDLDRPTRCDTLLEAGWQAFRSSDPRGRAWLEEALEVAPDPARAVLAWLAVWNWRLVLLDGHDPATFRDGLPEQLDGDLAYAVAGNMLLDLGFSGADLRGLGLVEVAVPAGTTLFERLYLCAAAMEQALVCGSASEALALGDAAWRDGAFLEEALDMANLVWLVISRVAAGEINASLETAQAVWDSAARRGSLAPVEWSVIGVGYAHLQAGDVATAEATVLTWLEEFEKPRVPVSTPSFAALLMEIHRQRGRLEDAQAVRARWSLERLSLKDWNAAFLHERQGHLDLSAGRFEDALRSFDRCRSTVAGFLADDCVMPAWRPGTALALTGLGRVDEARGVARRHLELARRWGSVPYLGQALRVLAVAVGGAQGTELAEEAVGVLTGSQAKGELSEAQLTLGRMLRLQRQGARAREVLGQALDRSERLGATLLADQIEEELRLAGARPRRRAVTGVQSLTPAELRVAALAADGLSNPEIAQSLFVTRKTVEKHLGSAFAKLHISSRDQLPAVLERP